jgi:hypothetical protein
MKSRLILLLLAVPATAAFAQYKCTAASGAVTFQQTPCPTAQTEQKLTVIPNGHPPPASGVKPAPANVQPAVPAVTDNVDKRMLARYERQRQRDALDKAVQSAQADKDSRAVQREQAIAAARKQFGDDPSNAQPLREALGSIDSRYKALAEVDEIRIQSARKALDDWDKGQKAGAAANP